jgi:hypothetical protein
MAWNQRIAHGGEIALQDVQVGPADSARQHAQQGVAGRKLWQGNIFEGES